MVWHLRAKKNISPGIKKTVLPNLVPTAQNFG